MKVEVSTVSTFTWFTVLLVHDPVKDPVPSSGGWHLEEEDHALAEGLEVVDLVQRPPEFDRHEEAHSEDSKDEHHQEEKEANIKQRRHGHGQREQ